VYTRQPSAGEEVKQASICKFYAEINIMIILELREHHHSFLPHTSKLTTDSKGKKPKLV